MNWSVPKAWLGGTAYIIGGGPSLTDFDWSRLQSKYVIGCNDAYLVGEKLLHYCIFHDQCWFDLHEDGLANFKGITVTAYKNALRYPEWVRVLGREHGGWSTDPRIVAFNWNVGALACNFAMHLGVTKIVLMGFDMKKGAHGENNWHPEYKKTATKETYRRFRGGFCHVRGGCGVAGIELVNAIVPSIGSDLPGVQQVPIEEVLK